MEFNIEIRRKQLESLDQFISSSKDRVDSILEHFGWNAEKVVKNQKETVTCPLNLAHRLPIESASTHIEKCVLRKDSYDKDDILLSEPHYIPGSTILLDDMTKVNILNSALATNPLMRVGWRSTEPTPKTSNRLLSAFTPDERLALYNYSVTATKGPPQVPEFNVEPKIEEKHNLTPYELKALERDAKRRRMKYRSKAIHTNNKSNTEITRELIDGQMELYEEWVEQKNAPILPPMPRTPPEEKPAFIAVTTEEKVEETTMGAQSPRSSQNSIKSQEDNRIRSRRRSRSGSNSRSGTRERSRSRSRKRDYRNNYRNNDYRHNNRRFEDRGYDRNRKYDSRRRDSRERRNNRSFSRTRSEY